MDTRKLLIELGTEELPAKVQVKLAEAWRDGVARGLDDAGLAHGEIAYYVSPRRLALMVADLATTSPDRAVEKRGPALNAAYKDGVPTQAALGFARSCGVEFDALEKLETDKGAWLVFRSLEAGKPAAALMPEIVKKALSQLPIPKPMRWGAGKAEFIRPVHWAVMLFGTELIETEILGIPTGRQTYGHRFMAPEAIALASPDEYLSKLKAAKVEAQFKLRRDAIRAQVIAEGPKHHGISVIDEELLDEVTGLVEWPVALTGKFEPEFLAVPAEALIATMKDNQKYFHIVDSNGKLLPYFITLANLESTNPASVIAGNERVVRPRLTDAKFFFETDRKQPLAARWPALEKVVFQTQLGTTAEKCTRVAELAAFIAGKIGADPELARRAARLSKCDLMTNMVNEFPELQGVMGMHYARHDGEGEDVAMALFEQYLPRYAGDALPSGKLGMALAIADKVDTLTGIFGIAQAPTGDKDPFALRRAAIGLLRILVENRLGLDLVELIAAALSNYANGELMAHPPKFITAEELKTQLVDFLLGRFRAAYTEAGIGADVVQAVLARRPTAPLDFDARVQAVAWFRELPEAEALAAANKRVANILAKVEGEIGTTVAPALLAEGAERALAEAVLGLETELTPVFARHDYRTALGRLASLRETVDRYFDEVMVNTEDAAVRANRLALLSRLRGLFLAVADISLLQK
ncbi:MAG: glycine--tRNA ligase subunit beta [Gammaproteobacteria bacterium]|nr:glycine--tRNA ligase subunit beta [Gammaproteobacteria bacterium]